MSDAYLSSLVSRRRAWWWMLPSLLLVVVLLHWQNLPDPAVTTEFYALNFVLFGFMTFVGAVFPATTLLSDMSLASALVVHFSLIAVQWPAFATHLELHWLLCQVILGIHSTVVAGFLGAVCFMDEAQTLTNLVIGFFIVSVNVMVETLFADLCIRHQESEETLSLMMDKCEGFCTIQRKSGVISSANQRFQNVFGGASRGKPFMDLVQGDNRQQIDTFFGTGSAVCAPEVVTCLRPASEGDQLEGLSARFDVRVIAHTTTCHAIVERARITGARNMERVDEDDEFNWDIESMAYTEHSLTCSTVTSISRSSSIASSAASSRMRLPALPQFINEGTQKDDDTAPPVKAETADVGVQTKPSPKKIAL